MEDLTNRVIIITGAAGGIGSATARALDARGARLVLVDRPGAALDALAADLAGSLPLALDVSSEADMAEMAWMTNDPDTLPFLALRTAAWPDQGGFNSGYYSNPEVDALLEQARVATSQEERAALYKEMQVIVQEDAPWVFVANWKQNAVTASSVENFSLEPSFFLLLDDVVKN